MGSATLVRNRLKEKKNLSYAPCVPANGVLQGVAVAGVGAKAWR